MVGWNGESEERSLCAGGVDRDCAENLGLNVAKRITPTKAAIAIIANWNEVWRTGFVRRWSCDFC